MRTPQVGVGKVVSGLARLGSRRRVDEPLALNGRVPLTLTNGDGDVAAAAAAAAAAAGHDSAAATTSALLKDKQKSRTFIQRLSRKKVIGVDATDEAGTKKKGGFLQRRGFRKSIIQASVDAQKVGAVSSASATDPRL